MWTDPEFDRRLEAITSWGDEPAAMVRDRLDSDGFHVFESLLDAAVVEELRGWFEVAFVAGSDSPGDSSGGESGTRHIERFVGAGSPPAVARLVTSKELLGSVRYTMRGAFRISSVGGRDPRPGFGRQGLHADWGARFDPARVEAVTAIWLLDPFNEVSGPTRVVPGTHRLKNGPPKSLANPSARHPDERLISAPPGSLLVFNGHLWHSGTRNETAACRRVVQCSFVARHHRYMAMRCPESLPPEACFLFEG